ncbi:Dihydrolipoamide dehydrogenase [Candidatus Syntrophocurvum alkaliphilum]|uniref:Dihydrolipoyl dehydrogenase n=1 Tax=Candidatus Syntrophocurvum alkaliphilum TaxID=2293317 RepID=A0A6I6DBQ1_9FIRM|nr:dihydrolipoyl dehydrogenase [Candidatus Syntrophocurvum alkaliphilum]QGT98884.1 Dihydrolipoamide dehydrogenase [Candidatus Syntrophocurvum alkaliphilum]
MKDLVIIGGGPGGYVAAIRASQLGLNVVLVEKDSLGGTCLNRGCIPTKSYFQNASVLNTVKQLNDYNISVNDINFDMAGAKQRKDAVVTNLVNGIEQLLKSNKIEVIKGNAKIIEPGKVKVNDQDINTKNIIIATGSIPVTLPIKGIENKGVLTSDEILEITNVPKSLAIIGGGVIGSEFACIFNTFGSEVTVFESQPNILGMLDSEIVKRMNILLKRQGISVNTSTIINDIAQTENRLNINASTKKGDISLDVDMVLVAGGRRPNTNGLGVEELGINTNNGFISVDENFATNIPGIYAIGDVTGGQMLAHVASEEGIVAVERICDIDNEVHYHAVPSCIFTLPEIATVGMSEEEAKANNISYKVGKFPFVANGKALSMGQTDGLVKVIADDENTILGVHILGAHASDLILEATLWVKQRQKTEDIIGTIHPHPTLGEALIEAVLDLNKQAIHIAPRRK